MEDDPPFIQALVIPPPPHLCCFTSNSFSSPSNRLADQRHCDREPLLDRCQEADRKVKGQAKNGGAAGRPGDPAEHP